MASIRPHRPLVLLLIAVASLAVILGVAAIPAPAPAPPAGLLAALPAPAQAPSSLRAPATRDRFYFLLPDRFDNADPSNDRGGLTGSREVTGFDPTGSAWFHGGDLKGTIAKLDYLPARNRAATRPSCRPSTGRSGSSAGTRPCTPPAPEDPRPTSRSTCGSPELRGGCGAGCADSAGSDRTSGS